MPKAPRIRVKCRSCFCDHGYMNGQKPNPKPRGRYCNHAGWFGRFKKCEEYK
jgi:hypothetical protein